MAILKVDTISGIGTEGPVFEGDIEFTSQNFLTLPKAKALCEGIVNLSAVPSNKTEAFPFDICECDMTSVLNIPIIRDLRDRLKYHHHQHSTP